jgi:hypothetical protein
MRPQIVHRAVDTKNPNHAAAFGRWGLALSLLCFGGSHERLTEHTCRRWLRHHLGDVRRAKGGGASTDLEQSSTKRFSKREKSANYRGGAVSENLMRTSLSETFLSRAH